MSTFDLLFDKYTEMRLNGEEIKSVYEALRDDVIAKLNRAERNDLSAKCDRWERERTQHNLTKAQQEALKRAALPNITVKIRFCPACDAPNVDGFLRCQVCNEPLAVEHRQSSGTTGITYEKRGTLFERQSQLLLKVVKSNDRLLLEPQISPTGLKVGRTTESYMSDVDLSPYGGDDYGVSRFHAIFRYDKKNNRLTIIDNNSTNGTFLNGVKLPPEMASTVSDGDELRLGRMHFLIKFKHPEVASQA